MEKQTPRPDAAERLYAELAEWWPLLSPASDYEAEVAELVAILRDACPSPPRTLLELGCGGGSMAFQLKQYFTLTLTDRSPRMLEVSTAVNPECEHLQGDMRSLDLGRTFDAVLVHDAIMYAASRPSLRATLATAARHLSCGGAVVLLPDYVAETYRPGTSHGGEDASDGRGLRYVEWSFDPDPADESFDLCYAFLLRETDGSVRVEQDRHSLGLFSREVWLQLLEEAGFEAKSFTDSLQRVVFTGRRSGAADRP
jgi:SAM-dependent methyltransferase